MAKTKQSAYGQEIKARVTIKREVHAVALREKLQASGHIQHIVSIDNELQSMNLSIKNSKNTEAKPNNVDNVIKKATARCKILDSRVNIQFKKLNKLLPDLKAVDLTIDDPNTKSPAEVFADMILQSSRQTLATKTSGDLPDVPVPAGPLN